jgi:hypothetical protein
MKFDIFGRKVIEIIRSNNELLALYCGDNGVRRKADDIHIPPSLDESELAEYVADVFHELATLERNKVRRI